ncbi:hypothetical protein GH714_022782 [Hevea brasiliensis]|uniref:Uncharacterized protein n=1 Tax=Hevea brasiliensis TaxID=3981 RepID=A0A6A6LLB1_HEVBR|nr:hypothetical protein GH714_022782 [Hevea brasiliensis]
MLDVRWSSWWRCVVQPPQMLQIYGHQSHAKLLVVRQENGSLMLLLAGSGSVNDAPSGNRTAMEMAAEPAALGGFKCGLLVFGKPDGRGRRKEQFVATLFHIFTVLPLYYTAITFACNCKTATAIIYKIATGHVAANSV